MRRLKTGIVGTGKVADTHAEALHQMEESDFRAVASRTLPRAELFAQRYGVKAYSSIEEMVDKQDLDVVLVCTPHPAHATPTEAALRAGAHVLVEKPLASSLADCDRMISAAEASGLKLGMISQRRLYESVQRMKKAIEGGSLGEPVLGLVVMLGWRDQAYYESDAWRGTWEDEGGGVLVNQAPHQLDLFQWFMGPIDELSGYWGNLNHPYIEVEDTAVAVVRFQNGALGNIVVSNSQNPALYGRVSVFGSNGAGVGVQTDGGAMFIAGVSSIAEPPVNDLWTVPGEEHLLEQWKKEDSTAFSKIDGTRHYHHLQIRDFLEAVLEDREPMVTGREGRKTVEIFSAIYRSQKEGKVKFPLETEASVISDFVSCPADNNRYD